MAQILGTVLAAKISPGDDTATFPTHEDIYGKGGLMSVQTLSKLSTGIPVDRQKVGMMIYVSDTSSYYTLTSTSYPLTSISLVSNTFATKEYAHSNFVPLTGNATITGPIQVNSNVLIYGNLSATGTSNFSNTIFSTTTALSVVHTGDGPAMWVGSRGTGDIASFYDIDQGVEVLHVAGIDGTFPGVGVKTSTPNKAFTVNGEISANNVIYDASGNSLNWNNTYTDVSSTSANWQSTYTTMTANSANWDTVYSTVCALSTNWQSTYTTMTANSANWDSTYTTMTANSANWQSTWTTMTANSANWDSTYTTMTANSANWQSTYTTMTANSVNWQSTYTTMTANSANWDTVYSTVCALSTSWEESADILPTVTNYLSTNSVLLSNLNVINNGSMGSFVLSGAGDANTNGTYYITNFTNADLGIENTTEVVYAKNPNNPSSSYVVFRDGGPAGWYVRTNTGTTVYYNVCSLPWEGTWSIVPGRPSPAPTVTSASSGLNVSNSINVVGSLNVYTDINARGGNSVNWNLGYVGFTNLTANSANWDSTYTTMTANSANWDTVYSTVCALSTSWEESADILPTVTNYLSTNNVLLNSVTVTDNISARGSVAASQSIIPVTVTNLSVNRIFTNADTNKIFHFDTTSGALTASFPGALLDGFNAAIMNTGTNYLYISSNIQYNAVGNKLIDRYSGAYVYKSNSQIFAVGGV